MFNDFRSDMPHLQGEAFAKNLEKVEQLRKIADAKQTDVAHLVLAWYLTPPGETFAASADPWPMSLEDVPATAAADLS